MKVVEKRGRMKDKRYCLSEGRSGLRAFMSAQLSSLTCPGVFDIYSKVQDRKMHSFSYHGPPSGYPDDGMSAGAECLDALMIPRGDSMWLAYHQPHGMGTVADLFPRFHLQLSRLAFCLGWFP